MHFSQSMNGVYFRMKNILVHTNQINYLLIV